MEKKLEQENYKVEPSKIMQFFSVIIKCSFFILIFILILIIPVAFISLFFVDDNIGLKIIDFLKNTSMPLILLLAILIFKRNISKFIDELKKLKFFENELTREDPILSQKSPQNDVPETVKESAEIKTEEIKKTLPRLNSAEEIKGQNKLLLEQVAELQVALRFERIYQIIFGSQIKLLEALRNIGSPGIVYEDIAAYYQNVRLNWPNLSSYSLENYLGYMTSTNLIILFIDNNQKKYKITSYGVDFLEYINKLNYIKEKAS